MENTSATTLTDQTLLDERAALDHDVDGLVSHELAHQWWGDLLTCREWSEAWLNEGFATYFEYVWREHAKGRDEADHRAARRHRGLPGRGRPLPAAGGLPAVRRADPPLRRHLYEKGGRVLHMLRHELGDAPFWRAIRHYARKHAGGSVETRDLARAIEDVDRTQRRAVPRPLDRAAPATRSWRARWSGTTSARSARCALSQKQAVTPETPLFEFSHASASSSTAGARRARSSVHEATHTFEFKLPSRPTQVIFDPGDVRAEDR